MYYNCLIFQARMADFKKSKRLEQRKRKAVQNINETNQEVALAMGFGGFRTSKK